MLFQTVLLSTILFALSHCAPHGLAGVEETYLLAGQASPAILSCVLYGEALADSIEWLFKGEKITIDDIKYVQSGTRLWINDISGPDEGLYSCTYLSLGVKMHYDLLCIFVLGAASFANSDAMTTIDALSGEKTTLDTRIVYNGAGPLRNNQTITLLQLYRDGRLVYFCSNEGPRKDKPCPQTGKIEPLEASHKFDLTLELQNLTLQDSGLYLLRVEVLYPGVSSRSYLTKDFSVTIHEPYDEFRAQQTNNTLECQVKLSNFMNSDLELLWTKPDGEILTESENVQLVSSVTGDQVSLTALFDIVSLQLEGEYSCMASFSLPDNNVIVRTASTVLKSNSSESTRGNDLQISIGPVTNNECGVWFDLDKSLAMELAIRRGLASVLAAQCDGCDIAMSDFSSTPGRLRCSEQWLHYKTTIVNMDSKDSIFEALEGLKKTTAPTIDIGLFTLSVNPSCSGELPLLPNPLIVC